MDLRRFGRARGSLADDAALPEDGGVSSFQRDPTEAAFFVADAKIGLTEAPRARCGYRLYLLAIVSRSGQGSMR